MRFYVILFLVGAVCILGLNLVATWMIHDATNEKNAFCALSMIMSIGSLCASVYFAVMDPKK